MVHLPAGLPGASERIGEILVRLAGVAPAHIERALATQAEEGGLLGEILVRMKAIDEGQLARALSVQHELPFAPVLPGPDTIDEALITPLPISFAKQHRVLPIGRDPSSGRVQVALADPLAMDVLDDIAVLVGGPVDAVLTAPTPILDLINKV